MKNGNIYGKLPKSPLAHILASIAVAAALTICVISGVAQSARTSPGSNAAAATSVQMVSEGKILFRLHCASCHYAESRAQKISVGLKGLYGRGFSNGRKVTDVGLAKWIEEGGKDMPGFNDTLKPEQVRALISYIKTL